MADSFDLVTTLNHTIASADDFYGTNNIRDTVQSYINSQANSSKVDFEYYERPGTATPFYAISIMTIEVDSSAAINTKINQINTNITGLPGTTDIVHDPLLTYPG